MIHVRNTFLQFLSDNLSNPVHYIRADTSDASADVLRDEAVSVQFIASRPMVGVSNHQVVLDVLFSEESAAVEAMQEVFDVLSGAYFTSLMDYTIPTAPVALGGNIWWDRDIRFTKVSVSAGAHYSCLLNVNVPTR